MERLKKKIHQDIISESASYFVPELVILTVKINPNGIALGIIVHFCFGLRYRYTYIHGYRRGERTHE